MKRIFVLLVIILVLFVSCGSDDGGKALLDPYVAEWGSPRTSTQEDMGGVLFVTYVWDNAKGHAKLILSKTKGKWEEVNFTSY